MKRTRGTALGVGLMAIIAWITAPFASALNVTPTVFLGDSPLLVTAYQRTTSGLQFVQLYNDGNEPLDISQWRITNESSQLLMLGNIEGLLRPKTHIIASLPGVVTGASASIEALLTFSAVAKLSVVPPVGSSYKQVEYELKAAGGSVWKRTTTTTGYSSSTTSFTAVVDQALFDDGWYLPPAQPGVEIVEIYPYASSCGPHDVSVLCGDYIKLHNPSQQELSLDDFVLRTDSSSSNRTSSNTFSLDGITIPAGGFYAVWQNNQGARISLTNSGGYVWLEDAWGIENYAPEVKYEAAGSGQQGFAWAQKPDGTWAWTSSPQPLGANVFPIVLAAEVDTLAECPDGKYRNPETNRCRTIEEAVNALAACPEGQYRNPDTNRCKATATAAAASLTPCKEGQERNPATNRCRSIASAVAELIPCDEGYERNPATNRCRKVQPLTNTASVGEAAQAAGANNAALPWVIGMAAIGALGYGIYEWRHELSAAASGILKRFKK